MKIKNFFCGEIIRAAPPASPTRVFLRARGEKQLRDTRIAGIYFSPCHESRRTRRTPRRVFARASYFSRRSFRSASAVDIISDYSAFKRAARRARLVFLLSRSLLLKGNSFPRRAILPDALPIEIDNDQSSDAMIFLLITRLGYQ